MAEFFNFKIERADGLGFALFAEEHMAYMLLCAALIGQLCLLYLAGGSKRRRALDLGLALGTVALELTRALLLALSGEYGVGHLPLHLCTMAVYILLFHSLCRGRLTGQFLFAFCMPGAAAAILMPDWSYYPPLHFMTVCGFLLHALIVAYPLMLTLGGDLRPDVRQLPKCLGLMLLLAAPVYVFDRLFDTNYMFLNWPPENTPLAWFGFMGRPFYVLAYLPMLAAVWAVLYMPFWIKGKKERTE